MTDQSSVNVNGGGIGIIDFMKQKSFFITGSTGFIAKVFVEKLLREVPEVKKVYLLMRARNAQHAQQRLQSEIIDCELFKRLKEVHGKRYEEFMRSKLVSVVGNVCSPGLGMEAQVAGIIADQVDVIVNVAGHTKWHGRYDVLLDVHVSGFSRLLNYAMDCRKLILFLHVSTGFVTRKIEGDVFEKSMGMDESSSTKEVDIDAELMMVRELASSGLPEDKLTMEMSQLGLRRAKIYGCSNTYQLTKIMGETILTKLGDKLPTIIIRPNIIESSLKEPFSGYIEGYRGVDPMILLYGQGHLQGIFADPTAILDIVPIDMVVNAMIAMIANHGIIGELGLYNYHIASSMANPFLCQSFFKLCHNHFTLHPMRNSKGEVIRVKDMRYFPTMEEYIAVGLDAIPLADAKLHAKLVRIASIYQALMFNKLRFSIKNTQNLFEKLSTKEKKLFDFDVESIDWEDYFSNIHFFGLRKHVLKENFPSPKL